MPVEIARQILCSQPSSEATDGRPASSQDLFAGPRQVRNGTLTSFFGFSYRHSHRGADGLATPLQEKNPPGDSGRQIKTLPTEEKTRRSSRSIRMLFGGCPAFRSFGGGRDRRRSGLAWPGGWLLPVGEHSGRLGFPQFSGHGGMEGPPFRDAESPERAAHPVP